jgi:mevalonate kinase
VLACLDVTTDATRAACASLRAHGAVGAKPTGAGLGGFAIGVFHAPPVGLPADARAFTIPPSAVR